MKKGKKAMASRFTKRKMSMEEQAEREVFLARQKFLAEMEKRRQACAVIMQRRIRGYALHLRFLAQRERLEWEREAAVLRIQTQWRRHVAWKEAQKRRRDRNEAIAAAAREAERRRHLVTCATDISRVYRGYVIRQKIKADGLAATKIQRCVRRWQGRKLRKIMKNIRAERRKQEEIAAIKRSLRRSATSKNPEMPLVAYNDYIEDEQGAKSPRFALQYVSVEFQTFENEMCVMQEKKARDQLKYESARQIQRIVRGCRGRRRVVRIKGDLAKEALREVYRRERIALEDKKKWAEQLDMEQFKADTVTRKERERKLLIAQQEEEIARLDAQTGAYKVQALEAQKVSFI
ncbi:hypothetical protein DYB25_002300 [Aphanomyces astaci]|uniref:Uncharacterized protein n=1 Tax=Aphanomyces astaci TaxID=112090 RepID=A0A397AP30_APHAT|nr:hypothetical protein DYB25_002300 [Aphanomyces astaci]